MPIKEIDCKWVPCHDHFHWKHKRTFQFIQNPKMNEWKKNKIKRFKRNNQITEKWNTIGAITALRLKHTVHCECISYHARSFVVDHVNKPWNMGRWMEILNHIFDDDCLLMKFLSKASRYHIISLWLRVRACARLRTCAFACVCVYMRVCRHRWRLHMIDKKTVGQVRSRQEAQEETRQLFVSKIQSYAQRTHTHTHTHTSFNTLALNKWYWNVLNSTRMRNTFFLVRAHRLILFSFKTQMSVCVHAFSSSFVFQNTKRAEMNALMSVWIMEQTSTTTQCYSETKRSSRK